MLLKEIKRMKKLNTIIITICLIVISSNIKAQTATSSDKSESSPFAVRMYVSPMLPFMAANLESNNYNSDIKNGTNLNIGPDFVYYFYSKDKFKSSISMGFAYSNYRSTQVASYENSIWTTDIDNDDVLITETVTNLREKQKINFLNIPIKVGFEYLMSENLTVYMSVGLTYGFNLKSTYTNEAILNRTGFYPDYNVLIYDVHVNGSPYFYPKNKRMSTEDELKIKNNFSFETSFGFIEKLNDKLSLIFGLKYMHGFTDIIDGDNIFVVKSDASYNYTLNSLSERGDKLSTAGFGFEVGVQYKLWK